LRKVRIGSRASRLARAQIKEIEELLPEMESKTIFFETSGDKDRQTPIDLVEGSDFFTDVIENALREKKIDLAIHSAKDLPDKLGADFKVALLTDPIDPSDVLVSKDNLRLDQLPKGAKVGTSSKRRKEQLLLSRPDLKIVDLRGDVDQRMERLDSGEYDAIVIAAAGVIRLGLEDRISERLPFKTAEGQGSLAIEVRKDDKELIGWLERSI
jgi:hydroxymethylbilane synthase